MSSTSKPIVTPSMCGIVCVNPKFTPDAASMMLFGPGVNDITPANTVSAISRSTGIESTSRSSERYAARQRNVDPDKRSKFQAHQRLDGRRDCLDNPEHS